MPSPKEPACVICRCTQNNVCPGGCRWVRIGDRPLCSNDECQLVDAYERELNSQREPSRPGLALIAMVKKRLRMARGTLVS